MPEEWRSIEEFPDYQVSESGVVYNAHNHRPLKARMNNRGLLFVQPVLDQIQYSRGLALIVAQAFVNKEREHFDTVIHKDGDRTNCAAYNLAWRPRWFAIKYHKQFDIDGRILSCLLPIRNCNTMEEFANGEEACLKYGMHGGELSVGIANSTPVFPYFHRYEIIEE